MDNASNIATAEDRGKKDEKGNGVVNSKKPIKFCCIQYEELFKEDVFAKLAESEADFAAERLRQKGRNRSAFLV